MISIEKVKYERESTMEQELVWQRKDSRFLQRTQHRASSHFGLTYATLRKLNSHILAFFILPSDRAFAMQIIAKGKRFVILLFHYDFLSCFCFPGSFSFSKESCLLWRLPPFLMFKVGPISRPLGLVTERLHWTFQETYCPGAPYLPACFNFISI